MATVTNEVLRIQFKGLGFHYEAQETSPAVFNVRAYMSLVFLATYFYVIPSQVTNKYLIAISVK